MMKTVKHIGVLSLLVIFLFGIMGISIFHHTCSSSNEDRISVYAEIFKEAPGSCCEGETIDVLPVNFSDLPQNFAPTPCCVSTNSFLMLHFISERLDKLTVKDVSQTPLLSLPLLRVCSIENQLEVHPVYFQFYSPPLFGKQLIHFLHQIKIPAHPALT